MSTTAVRPDILVSDLKKSFPTAEGPLEAVRNVSFTVERGKILCLIGPSGCGKSTILRVLAGLEADYDGTVELSPERRGRTAFLHQSPVLLPWRTVLQNASLGAELRTEIDEGVRVRVLRTLDRFGLTDFAGYMPQELSGGMKQRLSIIRALTSEPHILLCDEPFSAIDYVARFSLNTEFKRICLQYGITCVFVTHNVEEAIFLSDVLIVLSSRPCREISRYYPKLKFDDDAFRCRQSPEFDPLFRQVWEDLKH
jgi:NitT/TauT family transport system ATP-binding protein